MPGPVSGPEAGPCPPRKRVLVLDTGALIAGSDSLFTLGGLLQADGSPLDAREAGEAVEFQLVPEVAQETRDPRARARLALLTESAVVREPTGEAVDFVVRFSKATGDFAALSRVDLRVLALAWMLEKETNGGKYLKEAPVVPVFQPKKTVDMCKVIAQEDERMRLQKEEEEQRLKETDGWEEVVSNKNRGRTKPKKSRKKKKQRGTIDGGLAESAATRQSADGSLGCPTELSGADADGSTFPDTGTPDVAVSESTTASTELKDGVQAASGDLLSATLDKLDVGGSGGVEQGDTSELSDDDVGWISPDNLDEQLARDGGGQDALPDDKDRIGCVTTDFAMQNVLLQMGITLISVDGRRVIHRVRRYVLRCQSCTEVTREVERQFCGRCGNASLTRVTYDVDKNGVARIFLSSKFKPRLRGTKYSIPMPRGGRHNKDLILCEDQIDPVKLRRAAKQRERQRVDVLDPDTAYKVGGRYNPSRPFVVGYGSRNPNEGKPSSKVSKRK